MPNASWREYLRQSLYKKENGALVLPYLANNFQVKLESIAALPGVEMSKSLRSVKSGKQPALTGTLRSAGIEEGLGVLGYSVSILNDVLAKATYQKNIPANTYFLSFAEFEYYYPAMPNSSEFIVLKSTTCTFYKPGTPVHTYFYSHTNGVFFNIAVTKNWIERNIQVTDTAALQLFLDDKPGFLNWIDIVPDTEKKIADLWELLDEDTEEHSANQHIHNMLHGIIGEFFTRALDQNRLQNFTGIYNEDYGKIALAERTILQHLPNGFYGVEQLARESGLSETKLKTLFKKVFGFSMLQYYKEKNILLAEQLLKKSAMQIKQVAFLTGYTSVSKFIAAFKKRFGVQPGIYRTKQVA